MNKEDILNEAYSAMRGMSIDASKRRIMGEAMEEYARYIQKQEFERQLSIREEYAKQKALDFGKFITNDLKSRVSDWVKGIKNTPPDNYWEFYLKSKQPIH